MEEVQEICDRVAIMDAGRVLASGTLAELLETTGSEPPPPSRWQRNLEQLFMQLTSRSLRD
jgi:ABC-type multidrug transport system ATPase subunit